MRRSEIQEYSGCGAGGRERINCAGRKERRWAKPFVPFEKKRGKLQGRSIHRAWGKEKKSHKFGHRKKKKIFNRITDLQETTKEN